MRYLFEDYVIDTDRRELCRRGDVVRLEPQAFDRGSIGARRGSGQRPGDADEVGILRGGRHGGKGNARQAERTQKNI
jgi:hypothetical protein